MNIHENIISGQQLSENKDGITATRMFVVEGLTGDAASRQYAALQASGIPQRGDYHPAIPDIQVDDRRADFDNSAGIVRVTITYSVLDAADVVGAASTIEIGAGLQSERTNRDANGKLISRSYELYDLDADGNAINHRIVTSISAVDVQRPYVTYRVRMKLAQSPYTLARGYTGKVGGWGSSDYEQWMCQGITGDSSDGGATYDISFEFALATDADRGWRAPVEEVDPRTGQVKPGGTIQFVQVYDWADFKNLPVPEPS